MRFLIALLLYFGLTSAKALAVPPPDFLFNVGAQLAQIFAVVALFLSAVFGTLWQYAKVSMKSFHRFRHRKTAIFAIVAFILLVSLAFAWWYQQYQQQQAYQQWFRESEQHQQKDQISPLDTQNVLPQVASQQTQSFTIKSSDTSSQQLSTQTTNNLLQQQPVFLSQPLAISNAEFQKILDSHQSLFVLDGREDEEYDLGHFPQSTHIRLADLITGAWQQLPKDQYVYVFCWSGIRGKELATFLQSKGIKTRYLEDGANGWVKAGGSWEGEIAFSSKYKAEQYSRLFTKEEIQQQQKEGTVLVDTRPQDHFNRHHIAGSINIAIIYTPTRQMEQLFGQVPTNKPVITVCDDFVSCFDAKITGIKLEARGHKFLGRYNKPWEF